MQYLLYLCPVYGDPYEDLMTYVAHPGEKVGPECPHFRLVLPVIPPGRGIRTISVSNLQLLMEQQIPLLGPFS